MRGTVNREPSTAEPGGRPQSRPSRRRGVWLAIALALPMLATVTSGSAAGAVPAPGWTIDSVAAPTNFSATAGGAYQVEVMNAGSKPSVESNPVVITDTLPAGLTAHSVSLFKSNSSENKGSLCAVAEKTVTCRFEGVLAPDEMLKANIGVSVDEPAPAGALTNSVSVAGGGAVSVTATGTNHVSSTPAAFGPAGFKFYIDGLDGTRDTQAADHPYELTTTIDLNSAVSTSKELGSVITSVRDVKDVVVDVPLGFVASTLAAPTCTLAQLSSETRCPTDTIVGHIRTEPTRALGEGNSLTAANSPIWNIVPEHGAPAEFGFIDGTPNPHVFFAHVVPTPAGYVLQASATELPQISLSHIVVTIYGNPALRDGTGGAQTPMFTNPTSCAGEALKAKVYMDSWQQPGGRNPDGTPNLGSANWVKAESESPPVTGCDGLRFMPELFAQPTTSQADSPSGLEFELKLAQIEDTAVRATPTLKDATVSLPEGMTVDPSAANGLEACSVAQIGWLGASLSDFSSAPPQCPQASKIGSLEIQTPLIRGTLTGEMYVARQNENPFGSVLATYVVVDDPTTGIVLKIAGEVRSDPSTGRLTAFFPENAQLPFSDVKLHFFGGVHAELATPESCGLFTTASDLRPWSAPDSGLDATPSDSFSIGEACANGFAPSFTVGSTNSHAGAFSPFVLSFSRADTDQELAGLTETFPPGVSAMLTGVPLCPEAEANAGTCPEASRIGTVTVAAGPGPSPLFLDGKVFLTASYKGASFGESVVVPTVAGPFNFGATVVRGAVSVDPRTAQVTVVSDPFPTFLHPTGPNGRTAGIPIRLRRVDVNLDRAGFALNPTNCDALAAVGALTSTQGASAPLATPFQVTNCANLKFAPTLTVTTAGKASKLNGAGLSFKIAYPRGAIGSQSWFHEAKFDIPKQLPARLTTIQQACLADTFEHNRGACPVHSIIGHAVVHTPILPEPLEGPVYFVSYGGAAFPDAVLVLDGNNVHIELHGNTFINGRTGVTSATFKNTPDVPFETIEVTIPTGPFSEFGANLPAKANYSFCGQKLIMPTLLKASNGLEIHQNTRLAITGCPTAKRTSRRAKLAAALKACHRKHANKRASCETAARKTYGAKAAAKKSGGTARR